MKKLLISSSILLIALMTNAASVTWSAAGTSTILPNNVTANGVVAYLFQGSLSDDVIKSISKGTWNASGYLATRTTTTSGMIFQTNIGKYENETVSFSMLIFDASTYADASNFKYAEVNDVVFTTVNKTVVFNTALTGASWQSIPEPTSGLLMLLGAAGLTLKRKRA